MIIVELLTLRVLLFILSIKEQQQTYTNTHVYRIQVRQKLFEADKEKQLDMCFWFSDRFSHEHQFINNVMLSDEAHFYMQGYFN